MSDINKDMLFDAACEDIEPEGIEDYNGENAIEWIKGQKTVTVQLAGNTKLCNRVRKYAEEYPDEVQICGVNRDNSIVAHLPLSYIKITRPPKRELTEEQKVAARERLMKARKNRNSLIPTGKPVGLR